MVHQLIIVLIDLIYRDLDNLIRDLRGWCRLLRRLQCAQLGLLFGGRLLRREVVLVHLALEVLLSTICDAISLCLRLHVVVVEMAAARAFLRGQVRPVNFLQVQFQVLLHHLDLFGHRLCLLAWLRRCMKVDLLGGGCDDVGLGHLLLSAGIFGLLRDLAHRLPCAACFGRVLVHPAVQDIVIHKIDVAASCGEIRFPARRRRRLGFGGQLRLCAWLVELPMPIAGVLFVLRELVLVLKLLYEVDKLGVA